MGVAYWDGFDDRAKIGRSFEVDIPDGTDIIVAVYAYEDWNGYAFVLFRSPDGLHYEVNGSHCSCFGLEGQWKPEEVSWKELLKRKSYVGYTSGYSNVNESIRNVIKSYVDDNNLG